MGDAGWDSGRPGQGTVEPAVRLSGFSKTFGTARVLTDVELEIGPGELHALIGHNGSGKSTLVKCLSGFYRADAGSSATVGGTVLPLGDTSAADSLGLRFIHQDAGLLASLSVTDNIALGVGYARSRDGRIDWRATHRRTQHLLDELGYDIDARQPVRELRRAQQTGVAIARAIAPRPDSTPSLVVLDEPTANLDKGEADHLFAVLDRLLARGVAALLVSHHLEEVLEHARTVTVLRDGRVVRSAPVTSISSTDELVELMVGVVGLADTAAPVEAVSAAGPEPILTVRGLGTRLVRALDLDLGPGEIVGIAGISGSGREDVASAVFGGLPRSGEVTVHGRRLAECRPGRAVRSGMSLLPAQRHEHALFAHRSVAENVTASQLPTRGRVVMDASEQRRVTMEWINRLSIKPPDPTAPIEQLSGGNQQKALLARCLRTSPSVLVLDEPTQGVDVASAVELHNQIRRAAEAGAAVLVASSDNDELVRICTRILVLRDGKVAAHLRGSQISRDHLDVLTLRESA
jgi:ribose transport system ATP-binding protein